MDDAASPYYGSTFGQTRIYPTPVQIPSAVSGGFHHHHHGFGPGFPLPPGYVYPLWTTPQAWPLPPWSRPWWWWLRYYY